MSTQNAGHPSTEFTISTPFQSLRLLEVPSDLLDIITDPLTRSLKFKSAPPPATTHASTTDAGSGQRDGILHLCAGDKAWAVKQVSTSNSVYLIQPSRVSERGNESLYADVDSEMQDADEMRDAIARPAAGVTAVAQVGNFLELHSVKIDEVLVERAVLDLLPIYHPAQVDENVDLDFQAANEAKTPMSLAQLLDNIPVPDAAVKKACASLGMFESTTTLVTSSHTNLQTAPRCQIPSTRVLLDVWSKIIEASAIEGIRLDQPISTVQISNLLVDETDSAVAQAMLDPGGLFETLHLLDSTDRTLRPEATCRFIAGLVLSSQPRPRPRRDIATAFASRWTDLVPSTFVKHCQIETLISPTPSSFRLIDPPSSDADGSTIEWTGTEVAPGVVIVSALTRPQTTTDNGVGGGGGGDGGKGGVVSAAADRKRKWHEKFGAQRNLKR